MNVSEKFVQDNFYFKLIKLAESNTATAEDYTEMLKHMQKMYPDLIHDIGNLLTMIMHIDKYPKEEQDKILKRCKDFMIEAPKRFFSKH